MRDNRPTNQPNIEDRATQPMEAGGSFAIEQFAGVAYLFSGFPTSRLFWMSAILAAATGSYSSLQSFTLGFYSCICILLFMV